MALPLSAAPIHQPHPQGAGGGGSLSKVSHWVDTHRTESLAIGGGAVAGLGLWMRSRANTDGGATDPTTAGTALLPATDDTTSTDLYGQIEQQIQQLAQDMADMAATPSPATGGTTPAAPAPTATKSTPAKVTQPTPAPAAKPVAQVAPKAPTVAKPQPQNAYNVGQLVNASLGESIVQSVYDPVYGWLDMTNLGGIYDGGGGTKGTAGLNYGGSYLGVRAAQPQYNSGPNAQAFVDGGLSVNAKTGEYTERSTAGHTYTFG